MARLTAVERKSIAVTLENDADDARLVRGMARGLSVLRAFQLGETSLSNGELSKRTGLSKPTISRLSRTLAALGYLSIVPRTGHYQLGAAILSLYHSLLAGVPQRIAMRVVLQETADFTHLPASVGMRDQLSMFAIETVQPLQVRPNRFDFGSRPPVEMSAMGRAYLFAMPEDERELLLQRIQLHWPNHEWRGVRAQIDDAFKSIAMRGFCVSLGDSQADFYAVVTADGAVLAFSCSGMPPEVTAAQLETEIGPRLARAARQISIAAPTRK